MPTQLHPRYRFRPVGYSVPLTDLVSDDVPAVADPELPLDATFAVELMCRCVEIVAGTRSGPLTHSSVHPRLMASLRRDCGARPVLRGPRVTSVRFQQEATVTRLAGVVLCGEVVHAVTAEFRLNGSGRFWLTHFSVL